MSVELNSRSSHGVFELGVESIPGGFRREMSENRDDLGSRKREPGIGGTKEDMKAKGEIK